MGNWGWVGLAWWESGHRRSGFSFQVWVGWWFKGLGWLVVVVVFYYFFIFIFLTNQEATRVNST